MKETLTLPAWGLLRDRPDLEILARAAIERFNAMTEEEQKAHRKAQAESWVRGELALPKPRFKWVNGAKVYESYSDYLLD